MRGKIIVQSRAKKCLPRQQVEVTAWSSIPEHDHRRCVNTEASISSLLVLSDDQPGLSLFSLTCFPHRKTISCRSVKLTPPRQLWACSALSLSLSFSALSLSLSLEIHSQFYAAVATPTRREASQGPLLIVWSKRQTGEG